MAGRLFPANGGPSIVLAKPTLLIGRAFGCDIRLSDSVVSNRHCVLTFNGSHWMVSDLGSRNGTVANGLPAANTILKTGDTLIISAKFRFVIEYDIRVERQRFSEPEAAEESIHGDERSYLEHGPATKRLEPHDKDVWSKFEK